MQIVERLIVRTENLKRCRVQLTCNKAVQVIEAVLVSKIKPTVLVSGVDFADTEIHPINAEFMRADSK